MISRENLRKLFNGHVPEPCSATGGTRAAVALILRETDTDLQVLFIKRADNEHDPWSGNISFPGGRVENGDGDPRATAERETLEEVGIDLRGGEYLGHLADIAGSRIPIHVSCHVYLLDAISPFRLMDEEVADAFWISLADLADPNRHGEHVVWFFGKTLRHPGIQLPYPGEPALWGLTYRLIMDFIALVNRCAPPVLTPQRI